MSDHDSELIRALFPTTTDTVLVDILRRQIWIDGDIDDGVLRDTIRGLDHLVQLSPFPIELCINSNGGDVSTGLAIADYIKYLTSRSFVISTKVIGVAYSAGALISSAGTPGYRLTLPSSRFLIHQLSASGVDGNMEQLESNIKNLNALNIQITNQLVDSTKQPLRIIAKDLKGETYMSAVEAKNYGLVDRIIGEQEKGVRK